MTEYTTSSHAIREYMTSRQRTANWVQSHSPEETEFYSPSVPPSVLDGFVPSPAPSEAESSRSVPPRMLLRYADGRPDIPIEPLHSNGRGRRQNTMPQQSASSQGSNYRPRSGSHGTSPLAPSYSRRPQQVPATPEEIRVLPSNGAGAPLSLSSYHPRSRSLPRNAELLSQPGGAAPPMPSGQPPGPQVSFSQPPPWHSQTGRPHHPMKQPSIIYAPSQHSRTHYAPPPIYHHPPQMGPNGMIYSHSAPVPPTQYPHNVGSIPYPSTGGQHLTSVHEESKGARSRSMAHDRARSLSFARPVAISPSSSTSSLNSQGSGSTYYVLPAAGQKVHVIAPSPQPSIATATSTTKSPTSPQSASFRKPAFFQRLFNWKFSSASSTKGSSSPGRRLQRRHSTGGSGRGRPVVMPQGQ